jgi:pSer/pThr/pTyr-binding forkhead associated (FHA) protein
VRQASREHAERERWPIFEPLEGDRINPIALNKPVCVAGDRTHVNLALPSPKVSRVHVLFVNDENSVYLRDLASLNHVFVNDAPAREAVLSNGDAVRVGPYKFRCGSGFPAGHEEAGHEAPAAELDVLNSDVHVAMSGRTLLIGSRPDCDLRMPESVAAPAQAIVFQKAGRHFLRHLRNSNGTYVNDRKVGQVELSFGDVIRMGDIELRYQAATAHGPADEQLAVDDQLSPGADAVAPGPDDELGLLPLAAENEPAGSAAQEGPLPDLEDLDLDDVIPLRDEPERGPESALVGLIGGDVHPGRVERRPVEPSGSREKANGVEKPAPRVSTPSTGRVR